MWLYRAKTMNTHTLLLHREQKNHSQIERKRYGEKIKILIEEIHGEVTARAAGESAGKVETSGEINRSRPCRSGVEKLTHF